MKRIGIIGYGSIGAWIADAIIQRNTRFALAALCVRERQLDAAQANCPAGTIISTDIDDLLEAGLDVVVEAAGQAAVAEMGCRVLEKGCDLQILSTGALADEVLREQFRALARSRNAQINIPAGALAGFRGLMTLRQCGLTSVHYVSTKPSRAWAGTPAARNLDLDRISRAEIVYEGNAAGAARQFPANANLAAAVALAGVGFEQTRVTLVADPTTELNTGRVEAVSPIATMTLTMAGSPFASNPKTSQITGMSVLAALENSVDAISFV